MSLSRSLRLAALATFAVSGLVLAGLGSPAAQAAHHAPQQRTSSPPITLEAPRRGVYPIYGTAKRQAVAVPVNVVAQGAPFELWSTRASYDDPITTVWRSPGGDVPLPAGVVSSFNGLDHFLQVQIVDLKTGVSRTTFKSACLDGYGQRIAPDAPAYSPYPLYCGSNPYSLGGVQGIQTGWSVAALGYNQSLRLAPGRYDVTVSVAAPYAAVLGTTGDAAHTRVIVQKAKPVGPGHGPGPVIPPTPQERTPTPPGTTSPRGPSGVPTTGPVPDLRSLPAWGISIGPKGNYLRFSATVWNAGDSPMVVDGFRTSDPDELKSYQYFFDADGNQTGYVPAGGMEWDPAPTHQHWHFEDFATYSLLDANQSRVVKSRKDGFCLANTDAVDLTVPSANWNPDNTDLATDCGDHSSLSVREVLAAGWGDTYEQYRAGQSFSLQGLPNGTYYIEIHANPHQVLTESSDTNDVSLRQVVIGGTPGARTVTVPQVGLIVEPPQDGGGGVVHPGHPIPEG